MPSSSMQEHTTVGTWRPKAHYGAIQVRRVFKISYPVVYVVIISVITIITNRAVRFYNAGRAS